MGGSHVYVFNNDKKKKDITIIYDKDKAAFEIFSTDLDWKYSKKYNLYKHSTVKEAMKAPWQHWNYQCICFENRSSRKRKHTIATAQNKEWRHYMHKA